MLSLLSGDHVSLFITFPRNLTLNVRQDPRNLKTWRPDDHAGQVLGLICN